MIHNKILAVKHSCLNAVDDGEKYLCTYNSSPEKCLKCGAVIQDELLFQVLPPFSNAHVPIMFSSYPVARIAFIPSNNSSILNYRSDSNLHCGAIDSEGKVHNFTNQFGIQSDSNGWEESIIINISEAAGCESLTSLKWDEIIHNFVNTSKSTVFSSMKQNYDCLDFVIDIIRRAINDQVNRVLVAQWLSTPLECVILYADIVKQLESGSMQVIKKLHNISISQL
ncbi:MKRN2 opposite strand -like [Schistosoma japonicum]|uniref:MKRN2 opposite strand-like n=1 Tax=Schistosoma japonicum TaxID=6182 RepID=A0A4Z2DYB0_SCHJA|nr:MKRN2 opposite strand -like [Schistosoma japonicum]